MKNTLPAQASEARRTNPCMKKNTLPARALEARRTDLS